ncbi:MAG: hypothetical protein M0R17_10600 [Candidatus Omnitrophica bacterium]|jgi:hypothetical protein|nr:hypothetical protein [Candidatus Omnitrophota bacterium]
MTRDEFYDFYGGDSNFGNLITARGANKPDLDDFTESEYRRFKEAKRLAKVKATDVLPLLDKAKNRDRAVYHYTIIKNALSEGKPVPPEVLKDYPELQKEDLNESTSEKEPWQIRRDDLEFLSSRMWFNKLTKTEQQFIKDKIKTTDNIINLSEEENNILNTIKLKLENNGKLPKPKKEFWQMTYHQFVSMMGGAGRYSDLNLKETHFDNVEQALAEGKPVPPEVLKDYPELQKEDFDLTKFRITNVKQLREDLKR